MSQLEDSSRKWNYVMAVCALITLAAVICAGFVTHAFLQSQLQPHAVPAPGTAASYMTRLQQKVGTAGTPEATYTAYWSAVCDATQALDSSTPASDEPVDDEYEQFTKRALDYYDELAASGKLPLDAASRDNARFLDDRSICDFSPYHP